MGGVAGGATAVIRNPRKPSQESPVAIAPIAVTVSRAGQPGLNPAGRSVTAGVALGASVAEVGGSGCTKNGESSVGRSTGGSSWTARHGLSRGEEEKRTGHLPGAATPSALHRKGERGGQLVDGGGAGSFFGDDSTGSSGDGEAGGGPEDVEEVAKKLDFHTVFD